MSVNPPEGTLTIENSHLDVKGNVSAVALKLGTLRLTPSYGLDAVANVSNSTTHTLELSNATTGLVTTANVVVGKDLAVSGNATVTGDLNVSGALGILDAIYPVGTVIDRATAITDTHLNGKYKAFLTAPNQEWEIVDDGQDVVPLEYLTQHGETTSYCGRATLTPATALQSMTAVMTTLTGTEITGLTPIVGTTKMKYVATLAIKNGGDVYSFATFRIQVKEGSGAWTEITKSNTSWYHDNHPIGFLQVHTILNFGDSTNDLSEGRTSTVRPTIGLRVLGRVYNSSYDANVHEVLRFPTDNSTANVSQFKPPRIDIISTGPVSILKYKRTL